MWQIDTCCNGMPKMQSHCIIDFYAIEKINKATTVVLGN